MNDLKTVQERKGKDFEYLVNERYSVATDTANKFRRIREVLSINPLFASADANTQFDICGSVLCIVYEAELNERYNVLGQDRESRMSYYDISKDYPSPEKNNIKTLPLPILNKAIM